MEGILKFNLPEEQQEFETACKASKWYSVVWELDQWLRAEAKYHSKNNVSLGSVRKKIFELMEDEGVRFE